MMLLSLLRTPSSKPKRHNQSRLFVLFFIGLCLGSLSSHKSWATTSTEAREPQTVIRLEEAVQKARENHPSLKALAETLELSDIEIHEAGHVPNPQITGTFGTGNIVSQLGANHTLDVTQTLELGNKRGKRVAVAKAEKQRQIALYQQGIHHVEGDVKKSYLRITHAQREIAMLDEHMAFLKQLETACSNRPSRDYQQISLARKQLELSRIKAEEEQEAGEIELNTALGKTTRYYTAEASPSQASDILKTSQLSALSQKSLDDIMAFAKTHRADYQAASENIRVQQAQLALEKRKGIPDVDVGLSYMFVTTLSPLDITQKDTFQGLFPHASLQLPIFHNNKHDVKRARVLISQAQWTRSALERQLQQDIQQTRHHLEAAARRALFAESDLIPLASNLSQQLLEEYRERKTDALTVIFTIQTEEDAKREALHATEALYDAWIELSQVLGASPEALLNTQ